MKELFGIYNFNFNNNSIKIEGMYINKNLKKKKEIYLKETNSGQKYLFNIIDYYYGKEKNLEGLHCSITINIENNKNYKLFIDDKEFNWSNNQNKNLEFNENIIKVYNDNFEITLLNNGFKVNKRSLLSKINYNLYKIIVSLKIYKLIPIFRFLKFKSKYLLINDRVKEGNDNGEALFRYICENDKYLAKKTYYVIEKNNPKYEELKKIGKVLKFKSFKHKFMFLNSKIVATSYIGNGANVYNPFNEKEMEIYKDLINKRIIFLQHGVMMTDFHLMFNRFRMAIDKFVVSTKQEYERIKNEGYLYPKDSIIPTCLPRYDLLRCDNQNKILFFATWRKWLTANDKNEFTNTTYYKKIKTFLKNKELHKLLDKYNFSLECVIHAELTKYYDCFKSLENKNIKVLRSSDIVYSKLFNTCNILVTDYSSIHFDVGYLKKPVIYYQYDLNDFLTNHTNNGSTTFSYEEEGFGEIVFDEITLINTLKEYLQNGCKIKEKYLNRVNNNFFYTDNNNSKRVCEIIKEIYDDESICLKFNNVQ